MKFNLKILKLILYPTNIKKKYEWKEIAIYKKTSMNINYIWFLKNYNIKKIMF